MKNSPENILKKMYTGYKRSWFKDVAFRHATSISMTNVVPDAVIPLTGNTTIKLDLEQYLLSEGTPNPVYEGMRVDVKFYFCPQRLYTRGIYGDNIIESLSLEQLPLPNKSIHREYNSYVGESSSFALVCRGSLLNRLGYPALFTFPGGSLPLDKEHINKADWEKSLRLIGASNQYYTPKINMSLVSAYYDVCSRYYSNKFEDMVPIENYTDYNGVEVGEDGGPVPVVQAGGDTLWKSLSTFGETINHVRGVMNGPDDYITQSYDELFGNQFPRFNGIYLTDIYRAGGDYQDHTPAEICSIFANKISDVGLWPMRYDSHYQTMFFQPDEIDNLMRLNTGSSVESFRLTEAEFASKLKSILRGRTTGDWIDAQFGTKLKMHDRPICVGADSFIVNFQQIVASATTDGARLGDTASRAKGGSSEAFDENGKRKDKTIVFTTQEPGYLISFVSCTPPISYSDVLPRCHDYDTLADFPLPSYGGKIFQDLKGSDFVFTGNRFRDDLVVGSQPYGFDYMTNFNKVSGLLATDLKRGFVFKRHFDVHNIEGDIDENYANYLRSVYVEPDTFDNNFNDNGINGRQNFSLLTAYKMSVCLPFEKQVTNYNL